MRKFTFVLLICIYGNLFGQAPDTLWTKTYGGNAIEEAHSVHQTTDGGYIIGGYTESFSAGQYDGYLIRTDSKGEILWTKTFGRNHEDIIRSVQQTLDDEFIIAGWTKSYGAGDNDFWLIKINSSGDTLWTRTFGGAVDDRGLFVNRTFDDGYVLTGITKSFGVGDFDVWLIKTNSSGDVLWTKTYGKNGADIGVFVQQTLDGGYFIAGYTYSVGRSEHAWLIKTDADGDTVWTKVLGSAKGGDLARSAQQTSDGGYIITGYTSSFGAGRNDVWLIKMNSFGDTLWTKTFGGAGDDYGASIKQLSDGGYIIAGSTESSGAGHSDIWLIRTDVSGDTLWTKTIGGNNNETGRSVDVTSDGGYIITGNTDSFGAGQDDIWLIKISPDVTHASIKSDHNPNSFILFQNYPNPFNPSTRIPYVIPKSDYVTLKIYDMRGREIQTLVSEFQRAGAHSVTFDANTLSSGLYFNKLQVGGELIKARKMVLVR